MPEFVEVSRGIERLVIDPSCIIAFQQRGEIHIIYTTGGPIQVPREIAQDLQAMWKRSASLPK